MTTHPNVDGEGPRFIDPWPEQAGTERVLKGFRERFGSQPAGVYFAPGRVNLIGEHTDYNGGLSLPIALPHRTFLAAAPSDDDSVCFASAQTADLWRAPLSAISPGKVSGWGTYADGVTWALHRRGYAVPPLIGYVDSVVPFGAGLSSSAALEAVFALASIDLWFGDHGGSLPGNLPDRTELAEVCVEAENKIAGAPTGGMDQACVLRSAKNQALLVDSGRDQVELVPFDLAGVALQLLVIDTRAEHSHSTGEYGTRRKTCQQAARTLGVETLRQISPEALPAAIDRLGGPSSLAGRRVRHVVSEIERTVLFVQALLAGQWQQCGALMDASHASLRDDYEVSSRELDLAVDSAKLAGAIGARMTGGGFGGSAIALVNQGTETAVAGAIDSAFVQAGLTRPVFLLAQAASPAGKVNLDGSYPGKS
jgi:galactokinase